MFGTGPAGGVISRNTGSTVNTADKIDSDGTILETTTYGGTSDVTEEYYTDSEFTNSATNHQVAATGSGVVTSNSLVESNADYARLSVTTRTATEAGPTTTTTTTTV